MSIRENVVNMAEKVTGRDLDGDGDVGMRSCPVSKQTGTSCPAFRNPAFTMPKYPPLDPAKLPNQAEHGANPNPNPDPNPTLILILTP